MELRSSDIDVRTQGMLVSPAVSPGWRSFAGFAAGNPASTGGADGRSASGEGVDCAGSEPEQLVSPNATADVTTSISMRLIRTLISPSPLPLRPESNSTRPLDLEVRIAGAQRSGPTNRKAMERES